MATSNSSSDLDLDLDKSKKITFLYKMATSNSSSSSSTSHSSPNVMGGDGSGAAGASPFDLLPDDIVLYILAMLEDDPRHWARLSCVSTRLSAIVRTFCCLSRRSRSLPSDLLPCPSSLAYCSSSADAVCSSLLKLSVSCPGLLRAGILLENSNFGLERDIGPHLSLPTSYSSYAVTTTATAPSHPPTPFPPPPPPPPIYCDSADSFWSLFEFDKLYFDHSESHDSVFESCKERKKQRRRRLGPVEAHLASGPWTLSHEQGNKLLARRFRGDCLYICDWPGCVHVEEKRNYMLFRGVFKNFKHSRVWRSLRFSKREKIALNCAFCACKETWDLHFAICLRRVFGFHDDGEPVVRAYVCENGHVSGAWTDRPLYA